MQLLAIMPGWVGDGVTMPPFAVVVGFDVVVAPVGVPLTATQTYTPDLRLEQSVPTAGFHA